MSSKFVSLTVIIKNNKNTYLATIYNNYTDTRYLPIWYTPKPRREFSGFSLGHRIEHATAVIIFSIPPGVVLAPHSEITGTKLTRNCSGDVSVTHSKQV